MGFQDTRDLDQLVRANQNDKYVGFMEKTTHANEPKYVKNHKADESGRIPHGKSSDFQIKIPSRIFGLIENPSGFGVFSLKPSKINIFQWIRIRFKYFLNVQKRFKNNNF